jgi:hypothetical protein
MIRYRKRIEGNAPRRRGPAPSTASLLALAALVLSFGISTAEDLPDAATVLDGYIEATGGKAAHDRIENRVTKATFDLVGQGMTFDMTIYAARPNRTYARVDSELTGTIEKGTDGTTVWELSPMTGPQIKQGQEKIDMLRESIFDRLVRWREVYAKAECVGVETVSDKPAYEVVLTPPDGRPQQYYFDKASRLLVQVAMTVENPMGTIPMVTRLDDYRDVDGILLPHRTTVEVLGQERVITTQSIEHNVDLPADRFDLPGEIRELLAGKEDEKAESR